MGFANFDGKFIQGFSQITAQPISMLWTISDFTAKKLIFTDNIHRVVDCKVVVNMDLVGQKSRTEFLNPETRLAFAMLR